MSNPFIDSVLDDLEEVEGLGASASKATTDADAARARFEAFPPDSAAEKVRLRNLWQLAIDHVKALRDAERAKLAAAIETLRDGTKDWT